MALTELKTIRHAKGGLADKRKFYVIAGRGFAAILNHVALLRDGSRVDGRPILHIGEPDPWRRRRQMAMGQWPHLLSLPGFLECPEFGSGDVERFYPARSFAAYLAREEQRLEGLYLNGAITRVERDGAALELAASTASGEVRILAERIDLCSGAGPIRLLGSEIVSDPGLAAEYAGAVPLDRQWRGIVSGEDYLTDGESHPTEGTVCVYGGGGTAAWCVEAALEAGNHVLWVCTDSLSGAFVPSGRNDRLAHFSRGPAPDWAVGPVAPKPGQRLTIAERYAVASVSRLPDGRVSVRFKANSDDPRAPRHLDASGDRGALTAFECHQLVVAIGRASRAPGSMVDVMRQFVPLAAPGNGAKRYALRAPCGRLVGLRSLDGAIRFLGVAADAHPLTARICQDERIGAARDRYRQFVCGQARSWSGGGEDRGPALIPVAANDIVEANGLSCASMNRSINTMSPAQLRRWLRDQGFAGAHIDNTEEEILRSRRHSESPWISTPEQWRAFGFMPGNEPDVEFGAVG